METNLFDTLMETMEKEHASYLPMELVSFQELFHDAIEAEEITHAIISRLEETGQKFVTSYIMNKKIYTNIELNTVSK